MMKTLINFFVLIVLLNQFCAFKTETPINQLGSKVKIKQSIHFYEREILQPVKRQADYDYYESEESGESSELSHVSQNKDDKDVENEAERSNSTDYEDSQDTTFRQQTISAVQTLIDLMMKRIRVDGNFTVSREVPDINETLEAFKSFYEDSDLLIETATKVILPVLMPIIYEVELDSECEASLFKLINGIRNQKMWALKFLDASSHLTTGFLEGTIADFGEYDECLNIIVPDSDLVGKYCLADIAPPLPKTPQAASFYHSPLSLNGTALENTAWQYASTYFSTLFIANGIKMAFCVPSTCSSSDMEKILNRVIYPLTRISVKLNPTCDVKNEPIFFNNYHLVAIVTFSTLILLVILGTAIDWITTKISNSADISVPKDSKKTSTTTKLWRCFSATRNSSKLFFNRQQTPQLAVIHGLRVIAIIWIMNGHIYLLQFFQAFFTFRRMLEDIPRLTWWRYQPQKLTFDQVDTFFCISGVIVTYMMLQTIEKTGGRFNYFIFAIYRWLRYTPALIGLILIYFMLPFLGSGPIFKTNINFITETCYDYWWRNILYINNYYDARGNCATHTWFVAADFQLYLLAPILVLTLKKWPRFGLSITLLLILISPILCLAPYFYRTDMKLNFYHWDVFIDEQTTYNHLLHLYWTTYQHLGPYCLGILVGYLIQTTRKTSEAISKPLQVVIWIVCFSASGYTIFYTKDSLDASHPPRVDVGTYIFTATHKLMFSLLPSWIIYISAYNEGGVVQSILSWPPLRVFSRLSYCTYLVSLVPIVLRSYSIKYTRAFDDYDNWASTCLTFILSTCLAYLLHIIVEAPFGNLFKILMTHLESLLIASSKKQTVGSKFTNGKRTEIQLTLANSLDSNANIVRKLSSDSIVKSNLVAITQANTNQPNIAVL